MKKSTENADARAITSGMQRRLLDRAGLAVAAHQHADRARP